MAARLVVIEGYDKDKTLTFSEASSYCIGRGGYDRRVDLKLDPRECLVSRQHFFIDYSPPRFYVRDNHSTNGTVIRRNKETIVVYDDEVELHDGDRIIAGNTIFLFDEHVDASPGISAEPRCVNALEKDSGLSGRSGKSAPVQLFSEALELSSPGKSTEPHCANVPEKDSGLSGRSNETPPVQLFSEAMEASSPGKCDDPVLDNVKQQEKSEISLDFFQKADLHCISCNRLIETAFTLSEIESYGYPEFMCVDCAENFTDEQDLKDLKPYRILKKIGEGGIGAVYLARNNSCGMLVAIKTIIPGIFATDDDIIHFQREGSILQSLNNPYIARMYEFFIYRDRHYFIYEYIPEGDLNFVFEQISHGAMPWEKACRLICDILAGLQSCHDKGIMHLDIHPSNILFKKDQKGNYVLKLTDTGLAKIYENTGLKNLTRFSEFENTNCFTAPEIYDNFRNPTPQADIYATGVLLYYLLTGALPYSKSSTKEDCPFPISNHRSPGAVLSAHEPIPLIERNPSVPVKLCEIVDTSMRRKPEERFTTVKEMQRTISELIYNASEV